MEPILIVWCQDYDKSEVKRCVMLKSIGLYFRKIDFLNFAVGDVYKRQVYRF